MSGYRAFSRVYDLLTDDIFYPQRAAYFDRLLLSYGKPVRGILLDLACGTGSLSEEMAKLGWDVIGCDASEEMLSFAMEKKQKSKQSILYLHQTMEQLDLYGTVDAVVCALDGLNHIVTKQGLARALSRVSLFLAPDGAFVFDVNTPYKHREILANNTFVYDYDSVYLVWKNTLQDEDIIEMDLDLFERQGDVYRRENERFSERAYDLEVWRELLRGAGLSLQAVFAADTQNPPTAQTERLVLVAKKGMQEVTAHSSDPQKPLA